MNAKELFETGNKLFTKRTSFMSQLQDIAENFYPERADFTGSLGVDFAGDLATSYPLIVRRDLGNSLGAMLRPTAKEWFHVALVDEDRDDNDARRWMEWATGTMRRAMYDKKTKFVRATKEGDHDYAAFGQCVIQASLNRSADTLLYRCWHLRDVAWCENEDGDIGMVFRKWKPTARDLKRYFPGKVAPAVESEKDPFCEYECMHMIVESDNWSGNEGKKFPYVSIYWDVTHNHLMEVVGIQGQEYIIPRWQTVSGSQYAHSPATIAALPDARLIQAMTATLLEAGEKAVNPPMWAQQEVIRSDISIYAGGITWVDREYDERMGQPINLLTNDKSGIPLGIDMQRDSRAMIAEAFYLNKLSMPPAERERTAYEVGKMVEEYIRNAMPIFEPMEMDYNGGLCEQTFDLMLRAGAFGSPDSWPKSLQGAEIQFRFESPLHDAIEMQKGQKFVESKALIAEAMALDPSVIAILDAKKALRDVLNGIRTPAKWLRSEQEVEEVAEIQAEQAQAQETLQTMQAGADVAKTTAETMAIA